MSRTPAKAVAARTAEDLAASGAALRRGGEQDTVGGIVPDHVVRPPDAAALSAAMAAAARHGLTVVARGNGTTLGWGAPPRGCDLLVETAALNGIEHTADDLVATVGAGTPLEELRAVLGEADQHLHVDPLVAGGTVGGLVATGASGPRRMAHGPVRDLVIGMTTVRADGALVSSGGRVVKNVAGYDLAKLHTGALGTLGIITSVTFRLHPRAPALRLVSVSAGSAGELAGPLAAVRRSAAVPCAVELDWPAAGPAVLHVLLEGTDRGLRPRVEEVAALAGAEVRIRERLPADWGLLPRAPVIARVSVPPAQAMATAAALRSTAEEAGVALHLSGSAGTGVLYAALPAAEPCAEVLLAARAAIGDGSLVLLRAHPGLLRRMDPWGEVPGLELMRAVKDAFDPGHRLAPGRFAAGI